MDTSTWLPKAVSRVANVTANGSTTVAVPPGSTLLAIGTAEGTNYAPIVTVSGNTVAWSKPSGATNFRGDVDILIY